MKPADVLFEWLAGQVEPKRQNAGRDTGAAATTSMFERNQCRKYSMDLATGARHIGQYLVITGLVASNFTSARQNHALSASTCQYKGIMHCERTRICKGSLDLIETAKQLQQILVTKTRNIQVHRVVVKHTEKSSGATSFANGTFAEPGIWPLRIPGRGS